MELQKSMKSLLADTDDQYTGKKNKKEKKEKNAGRPSFKRI